MAQVCGVKIAVLIKHLGMFDRDSCASRAAHAQTHPTHHILCKVKDGFALRRLEHAGRLDLALFTNGCAELWADNIETPIQNAHTLPAAVVVVGRVPTGQLLARIVGLAVVEIVRADGACGRTPICVALYNRVATIGIGHM